LKTRRALAASNTTSGIFLSLNQFAIQESWRNIAGLVYMERNLLFEQEDIHSGRHSRHSTLTRTAVNHAKKILERNKFSNIESIVRESSVALGTGDP
jgi:hypothetical protein